ncbi:hypothetical protein PGB90_006118 [Kerria lacca]
MFCVGKFVFASILIVSALYSGVYGDVVPFAPLAPLAVAPFARSFSAHTINHALAAPVAAPLIAAPAGYPLPLPYTAPYYATL